MQSFTKLMLLELVGQIEKVIKSTSMDTQSRTEIAVALLQIVRLLKEEDND